MLKPIRGLRVVALAALLAASVVIAACGSSDDSGGGSGKASIRLFSYDNEESAKLLRGVLGEYTKANPDVSVKLDTLPGTGAPQYTAKLRPSSWAEGAGLVRIWGGTSRSRSRRRTSSCRSTSTTPSTAGQADRRRRGQGHDLRRQAYGLPFASSLDRRSGTARTSSRRPASRSQRPTPSSRPRRRSSSRRAS